MNKLNTTEAMKLRPRKKTQLIQANASDNYGKKNRRVLAQNE